MIDGEQGIVAQEIDRIVVQYAYFGKGGAVKCEQGEYEITELPCSIVVHRGSIYDLGVKFWLRGYKGNEHRINKYASAEFPESGTREIRVTMEEDCLGRCLSEGQTCDNGACAHIEDSVLPHGGCVSDVATVADAPDGREDTAVSDEGPAEDVGPEDMVSPDEAADQDMPLPDEVEAVEGDALEDQDAADVPPDLREDEAGLTPDAVEDEDAAEGTPSMDNWDLEDWNTSDPPPGFVKTTTADFASYTMTRSTQNHTLSGQYSAALTWNTTNTVEVLAEYHYPVVAGNTYSCHGWFLDNDTGGRARLVLVWYDASDVVLVREFGNYTVDSVAWQEIVYQSTHATAVTMTCGLRLYDVTINWDGDATIYFDDLSITSP